MKKLFFLIFINVGLSAQAQDVEFGVLMWSGNISRVETKETDTGNTSTSGWKYFGMAGWYARFYVSEKWALQPELLFARYGGRLTDTTSIRLNYVALPVLGRIEFTPKIFAFTGPQLAVLVSGIKEYGNEKDVFKRMYASWLFGAGYAFRELGLDVSLRYDLGLSDIHAAENIKATMSAFQIVLNYRLIGGRPIFRD